MNDTALARLQGFLSQVLHREQQINPAHVNQSLVFADALLLAERVKPQLKTLPPQIAVVGPTQAGKSSVVNLLLNTEAAIASPLAGYTRHAQGFINRPTSADIVAATDSLLPWLTRVPQKALSNDDLQQYSLTEVPSGPGEPARIVWDSPDFDSVSSRTYRSTVPMLCAISDLLVMVVSREKYADQSVWELLRLFAPAGRPTLLCINKTQAETRAAIVEAVEKKLKEESLDDIEVFALPYLHDENQGKLADTPSADILREHCEAIITGRITPNVKGSLESYLALHWDEWITGIRAEHESAHRWHDEVTASLEKTLEFYQQEYLNEPRHTHALQKTMVRLLELLEVPGVGGPLSKVRNIITWPVRQLGGFVKKQQEDSPAQDDDPEKRILEQGIRHALLELSKEAGNLAVSANSPSRQWWQALLAEFNQRHPDIEAELEQRISAHQEAFAQRIEEAADDLYAKLAEHPMTLNGLRAARATTDAAAVVLALKSGGIGVHDLVFTPAMLAFSSLLTEGALGQYMNKVEKSLREAQLDSVREHVITPLTATLDRLSTELDTTGLYAIPEEDLTEATRALEELT